MTPPEKRATRERLFSLGSFSSSVSDALRKLAVKEATHAQPVDPTRNTCEMDHYDLVKVCLSKNGRFPRLSLPAFSKWTRASVLGVSLNRSDPPWKPVSHQAVFSYVCVTAIET